MGWGVHLVNGLAWLIAWACPPPIKETGPVTARAVSGAESSNLCTEMLQDNKVDSDPLEAGFVCDLCAGAAACPLTKHRHDSARCKIYAPATLILISWTAPNLPALRRSQGSH